MRFLPVFLDLQTGPVLLVGAGELAQREIAPACRQPARAFAGTRPMAITMSAEWAAADAARIELAEGDPLDRRSRRRDRGPVRRRRRDRDCDGGAGAGRVGPARQCDGRPCALDLHFSRHRRSRRRGGRDRHRRSLAGGGAPGARAHRGRAAGADRRSRRLYRPLAQADPRPDRRHVAAPPVLGARGRRPDRRAGARRARATRPTRLCRRSPIPPLSPARSRRCGGQGDAGRRRSGRSGSADHQGAARAAGRRRGVLR